MASSKIRQGTTKRFGPRYGRTVKDKLDKVESMSKAKYKCPYCLSEKVKRQQAGIWMCGKCDKKFTSRAYSIPKTMTK